MVYLLPFLAVLLSFSIVWFSKPKQNNHIKLLLAFSGAFLLSLTFFDFLPEIYEQNNSKTTAVCILVGILLQIFLEFFSKGAEHGHMHLNLIPEKFPIALFLSLSLHALIEGIPLQKGDMLWAILVHKIPVAMLLSIFLLNSKLRLSTSLVFMVLFALMTPLGSFLASETNFISNFGLQLNAIAIGIFFHVSTVILFESGKDHNFNLSKVAVIILGVGAAYLL
ncbi:ZIP family metal transporter [Croceivirga thetidis]|uniref:ZIP family metal transporter n=1 Tax=Croceivirga thetidis TaxID=2721623 RepID=A0ABX1GUD9_9FLAO|nr:ZIP family metal transporter [Croceivirga thetidis]NKI33541.1 ZIP family metal transporter [Croceivirga thetidis]